MDQPTVGVVVVNHNQKALLRACLESWRACDYPALSLLVSDDASTDGALDMLAQDFPGVRVLSHRPGIGFAAATNAGLTALAPDHAYVLAINNDTLVEPAMLSRLVAAAEADPQAAIVGPKILYEAQRDRVWFGGGGFHPWLGYAYHAGIGTADRPGESGAVACGFITGCCFLVRSPVGQALGFFRPELGFVAEDTDLCSRAREAGGRVLYVPEARMYHRISASLGSDTPRVSYYSTRNGLAQAWRHHEGVWPLSALAYSFLMLPRYALGVLWRKGWAGRANLRAMLLGARDFLTGDYGLRDVEDPAKPWPGTLK
jgi:GT2 family glycosyltransferase